MIEPFHLATPRRRGELLEPTRGLGRFFGSTMIETATGRTWNVARADEDHVARVVIASELYRGLGLLVPMHLRVDFARSVAYASPAFGEWQVVGGAELGRRVGDMLAREWPVDEWLGFLRFPRGVAVRAADYGFGELLRWDLSGVLGGDRYRDWSWSELPPIPSGLAHARAREAPELGDAMRVKIGEIPTSTIAAAIAQAGLTGAAASAYLGPLVARRRRVAGIDS